MRSWLGSGILAGVTSGRKCNPPVKEELLVCTSIVRMIQPHLDRLAQADHPRHGNVRLEITDALVVMLAAFFNPTVRSLRLIEQLSQIPSVKGGLNVERICKSTLSDAFARFEPDQLLPLIQSLMAQVPQLARLDGDLDSLCRKVLAADGSYWNIPSDVLWALGQNRSNVKKRKGGKKPVGPPKKRRAVRLNWQLDVSTFTPTDLSVSGADEGSEAAAFIKRLASGVIYVVDRNFVHFGFINAVLEKNSDLVLRLRKDTHFNPTSVLALSAEDRQAGVVSDRLGTLGAAGSADAPTTDGPAPKKPARTRHSRTGPAPARVLREVIVTDPETGESIRLITSLLDVPAHVIASIYRHRWQIELFFRWLKVWANVDHLLSHNQKGITLQFYVAIIACLLMHIRSGRKVNKYAIFLLGQVAAGQIDFDAAMVMLDRIEREKRLEKERLTRKKAASKNASPLPA